MDKIRNFREKKKQEYQLTSVDDKQIESESIWNTLHQFGISQEELKKKNLSNEELYNIRVAVKTYQDCQKVLQGLEEY